MMKNARDGGIHIARKRQETLVLFNDVLNITEKFSDAQFGALMRTAFDYRFEGESYQGGGCPGGAGLSDAGSAD